MAKTLDRALFKNLQVSFQEATGLFREGTHLLRLDSQLTGWVHDEHLDLALRRIDELVRSAQGEDGEEEKRSRGVRGAQVVDLRAGVTFCKRDLHG